MGRACLKMYYAFLGLSVFFFSVKSLLRSFCVMSGHNTFFQTFLPGYLHNFSGPKSTQQICLMSNIPLTPEIGDVK